MLKNLLPRSFRPALILSLLSALPAFGAEPVWFDAFAYSGKDPMQKEQLAKGEFRNPILTGFYPDPSICQVGDDYYLINSTFAYFPGIPIFHSKDLVNWEPIGNVIHRPEQLPYEGLGVSRGIFAPAISYHDGTFYVVCTHVDAGGNFVVTAKDPRGPWSDPVYLHFEGIDPSLFFDDDGRAWMINNGAPNETPRYSGHRAIWIQEFDYREMKMIGPRKQIINGGVDISKKPVWIEGPHIYRKDGWYYLCCAEGGTSVNHTQVIFRSKNVDGPYEPWNQNPILTQQPLDGNVPFAVTSTGHADLVVGPDKQWWAVFLAVRPYEGRYSPMGRETFLLPVDWPKDGWPRILEAGKRVPLVHAAPKGVEVKKTSLPLNGNFSMRDEFDQDVLGPQWLMLRAPKETWWTLDSAGSRLGLVPREDRLTGKKNPSFFGHRVQHANFTAETTLQVPSDTHVSAGLAAFQGEGFHYYISAMRTEKGALVQLEKVARGNVEIVKSAEIPSAKSITFRITAADATCAFSYSTESGKWVTLADNLDAKLLTTEIAGGFVGATVGPHTRLEKSEAQIAALKAGKETYVIVHGAWAGGWEWKRFAEALEAKGHRVYRPTLSGQGERVHLAKYGIDLETHIADVANFIKWEDLRDIILVGHSYGGMVITGVADQVSDRLKQVIYLDAFLPEDGESAQTSMGRNVPPRKAENGFFSIGNQEGNPLPHVVPQPEKTFTQPIKLEKQDLARKVPTRYILTVDAGKQPDQDTFNRYYERAKERGWEVEVMEADHVPHLSQTDKLVERLVRPAKK